MVSNCIKVMLISGLLFCTTSVHANALSAGGIVFNEIQTGSSSSATEEFIELYNAGTTTQDLTGWQVQYSAAGSSNWDKPTRKINLSGAIAPNSFYLLASSGYSGITPNVSFSSTLATAGGHLRLVNGTVPEDLVGWGTAAAPLGAAAEAPQAGQSLNRVREPDDKPISPTSNQADYYISNRPTPGAVNSSVVSQSLVAANTSSGLEISEILPNPASPVTDAAGEFIELYNSGTVPAELAGYKLTSGSNDNYKYIIPAQTIAPGQYLTFYSSQTHLTLSNAAGRVRLFDAAGSLADETGVYDKAGDNQSWIFAGNSWQWTIEPTPNAANILQLRSAASAKKSKSVSSVKSATKTKTTKPKTRTAAATKAHNSSTNNSEPASAEVQPSSASHPYILAGAGLIAVLYACYEYRADLANRLHQFRKNRAARRSIRSAA